MPSQKEWFFRKLDSYVRKVFQCFVAEMFASKDQAEYIVCFRRAAAALGSSSEQYACRYVNFAAADVDAAHRADRLTPSITEKLMDLKELE